MPYLSCVWTQCPLRPFMLLQMARFCNWTVFVCVCERETFPSLHISTCPWALRLSHVLATVTSSVMSMGGRGWGQCVFEILIPFLCADTQKWDCRPYDCAPFNVVRTLHTGPHRCGTTNCFSRQLLVRVSLSCFLLWNSSPFAIRHFLCHRDEGLSSPLNVSDITVHATYRGLLCANYCSYSKRVSAVTT